MEKPVLKKLYLLLGRRFIAGILCIGGTFSTIICNKGTCHGADTISTGDIWLLLSAFNRRRPWNIHNCSYDLNYNFNGNRKVPLYDKAKMGEFQPRFQQRSIRDFLTGSFCLVSQIAIISLVRLCFVVTSFTYLQVYRSIRHHQQQIQARVTPRCFPGGPFINMAKYKKSVFTILLILASFYLSYFPFIVNVFLLLLFGQSPRLIAAYKVSVVLIFTLSAITPILYCWKIRQIRDGVRQLLYKLLCRD